MTRSIVKASLLVAVAGCSVSALGVVNTTITWQVSRDGTNWASAVQFGGGTVYVKNFLVEDFGKLGAGFGLLALFG